MQKIPDKIKDKLIKQGYDILRMWIDIDRRTWKPMVAMNDDETTAEIMFINALDKAIVISNVYFDENNGEIIQYGSNYGQLVL